MTEQESQKWENIKLAEVLTSLLQDEPKDVRKKVCETLGVSSAAISNYCIGRNLPTLDKAVLLADLFDVSLDFLVRGKSWDGGQTESSPNFYYIERVISKLEERTEEHTWLVGRIAHCLSKQVNQIARENLKEINKLYHLGVSEQEVMEIEMCSSKCDIITTNLADDIHVTDDGFNAGRFCKVLTENIKNGCHYRFLLPQNLVMDRIENKSSKDAIESYRRILIEEANRELVMKGTEFGISQHPIINGCVIYELRQEIFSKKFPILFERVKDSIFDGWIGITTAPAATSIEANILMDRSHLKAAKESFETMWPKK